MGKLADAIRGLAIPAQKLAQLIRMDAQYVELETQMDSFQEQNAALEAENKRLQDANKKLKEDVARLEAQLKARTSSKEKSVVHDELDEIEKTFLSYLAYMNGSRSCTLQKIATALADVHPDTEMTKIKAEVYLRRLAKRDLVGEVLNMEGPSYWILQFRGKEYVVLHKLEMINR